MLQQLLAFSGPFSCSPPVLFPKHPRGLYVRRMERYACIVDTREREEILLREMKPWLEKGCAPQSVTESNAYLVQQRKIKWFWFFFWGIIIPVIGAAFYVLAVYAPVRDFKTVSITADADGEVWVQKSRTRNA
jgi:hypothetical protein